MIEKGRTGGDQFETAAADRQMNCGSLIRIDAKTAAFAFIEPTIPMPDCGLRRSIQTTERYLGGKQRIRSSVNDRIGIEPPA